MYETTILKWGNSSGIRLPKELKSKIGIDIGTKIKIETTEDGFIIKKIKKRQYLPFTENELIADLDDSNINLLANLSKNEWDN